MYLAARCALECVRGCPPSESSTRPSWLGLVCRPSSGSAQLRGRGTACGVGAARPRRCDRQHPHDSLRRLRRHGLIARLPKTLRYTVTADGLHLAFGLSRLDARLFLPNWDALLAPSADLLPTLREARSSSMRPLIDSAQLRLMPSPTRLNLTRRSRRRALQHAARVTRGCVACGTPIHP